MNSQSKNNDSDLCTLLEGLDQTAFSSTAYDTAWVAQVPDSDGSPNPAFPQALDWLRHNQNIGGSWGSRIEYYHDRVISTLAALIALAEHGDDPQDGERIKQGEQYVHYGMQRLDLDPCDTVGFELILPTLMDRAHTLGLDLPYHACEPYRRVRDAKLQMIPDELIYSRRVTSTHSLEFMGDALNLDRCESIQEINGSCGSSPSATAYLLTKFPDNQSARDYLQMTLQVGGGAAMPLCPIEIFNKSWVLYNLELAYSLSDLGDLVAPHLEAFLRCWNPQYGVSFSEEYSVPDLDDTAVVFKLLRGVGYDLDPGVLGFYEEKDHFMCYQYERNPSIGVHVHLLDAMHVCPRQYPHRERMIKKALRFLYRTRIDRAYWFDKWHISPYYITSHAVIAAIGFDDQLARDAVRWILATQRDSGAWGYYMPTNEETAYCLQALLIFDRCVAPVKREVLDRAAAYLYTHRNRELRTLWIEKSLYIPLQVVEAAIVSALALYEQL